MTSKEVCQTLKITRLTLNNWKKAGKIPYKKLTSKKFLYDVASLFADTTLRKNVIYSRVSNSKQEEDLTRQTKFLREYVVSKGKIPDLILEEIASGMNENRSKFNTLLQMVLKNEVDTVYISYKDRLVRFGFGYFEKLFSLFNTNIEIVNLTTEEDFQQELTEDLISIIHHFSMKMYSNRRKELKKIEKFLQSS